MKTTGIIKKKVLVIDDERDILSVMKKALELKGYDAHTSETFLNLEEIRKISPDCIYLDISLKGRDGRQITRELKGDERTKNIPIIIVTGHSNAQELAREAKADDYLSKPFKLERLWKMTARHTS